MNPVKVLNALFIIIDAIHEMYIAEWLDFINDNVAYFVADLTNDEKVELVCKLMDLNLNLGSYQWHRRFNVVGRINEFII